MAGSPYEMGLAHGQLMKMEMTGLIDSVWAYLEAEVVRPLFLPLSLLRYNCVCICSLAELWGSHVGLFQESAINGTLHKLRPWFVDLVAEFGCAPAALSQLFNR